jgi:hypothetical protein
MAGDTNLGNSTTIIKATLAKKVGNNINIIYPRTSVDNVISNESTGETLNTTLTNIEGQLDNLEESYGILVTLANDIDTTETYNVYIYNNDEDNGYFVKLNNNYYEITFDDNDLINTNGNVSISGSDISTLASRPTYSSSNDSDMSYDWGGGVIPISSSNINPSTYYEVYYDYDVNDGTRYFKYGNDYYIMTSTEINNIAHPNNDYSFILGSNIESIEHTLYSGSTTNFAKVGINNSYSSTFQVPQITYAKSTYDPSEELTVERRQTGETVTVYPILFDYENGLYYNSMESIEDITEDEGFLLYCIIIDSDTLSYNASEIYNYAVIMDIVNDEDNIMNYLYTDTNGYLYIDIGLIIDNYGIGITDTNHYYTVESMGLSLNNDELDDNYVYQTQIYSYFGDDFAYKSPLDSYYYPKNRLYYSAINNRIYGRRENAYEPFIYMDNIKDCSKLFNGAFFFYDSSNSESDDEDGYLGPNYPDKGNTVSEEVGAPGFFLETFDSSDYTKKLIPSMIPLTTEIYNRLCQESLNNN